jgi:hypothetical protein
MVRRFNNSICALLMLPLTSNCDYESLSKYIWRFLFIGATLERRSQSCSLYTTSENGRNDKDLCVECQRFLIESYGIHSR